MRWEYIIETQLSLFTDAQAPVPVAFVETSVGCWNCNYGREPHCIGYEETINCTQSDCRYSGILTRSELQDTFYSLSLWDALRPLWCASSVMSSDNASAL